MRIIYRLEDSDGHGPFFYRDGTNRTNPKIHFEDFGLYAFTDPARFKEPNYAQFLNDPNFHLYRIVVKCLLFEWKSGQVLFDESDIIYKTEVVDKCMQ